jgi:hypothetical protein
LHIQAYEDRRLLLNMALFGKETEQDEQRAEAYARWLQQRNPFAIASAVLGVFSLVEMGVLLVFGIAGTVLGVIALRQLRGMGDDGAVADSANASGAARASERLGYADADLPPPIHANKYEARELGLPRNRGRRLAWFGIVTSVVSLVIAAVLYLLPLMDGR